jgi:hypothetical protein
MSDHRRHTTITPEPVSREKPATIGDALELDSQHASECSAARREECARRDQERADKDGVFWGRIVAAEASLKSIQDNMSFLKWLVPIMATVLLTIGILVAKYAIVGAITLELDKRIPPGMHINKAEVSRTVHFAEAMEP